MKLEVGDIIFVRPKQWYSRLIAKLTRSEFSHVTIVFDPSLRLIAETTFTEIFIRDLDRYEEEDYEVYRVSQDLEEQKVQKEIVKTIGVPYDYIQLVSFIPKLIFGVDRLLNNRNKMICSEMVDIVYSNLGINLMPNITVGSLYPEQLRKSKVLAKVEPQGRENE